ncbi:MAG: lipopolysaccharide biosynthesis protein [Eubacteriales bacterium]
MAMEGNSRTGKSIHNIIGGFIYRLISIVFPFIIRTVMIQTIGVQYLGINSLFTSILSVLSLSELGVGSALVFNMYRPMAENDTDRICALVKVYRDFYHVIGAVILAIGLLLLPALKFLISGTYPEDINIYVLYLIYLGNTVLSYFLFAYKKSLWEAGQNNGIENKLAAFTNTLMYIGQIVVLLLFRNYYVYIILLPLSTLLQNLMRNCLVNKMYPQYQCRGRVEPGFIKELFSKVKALLGHKIGTTVVTSADSIVISSMFGLEVLAVYSNYYQILNALIGFVTVIYTAITASVGNSIITATKERVFRNFKTLTFMNNWLVGWFSVCLLCLYQPFMRIWMGDSLMFPFHIVILFVAYFYSWLIRRIGLTYKDAAGMWEQDFWKPYIGAVLNFMSNIILCYFIGIEGVLISTIIVMTFIYFPWETRVLFKCLFQRSAREYVLKMAGYVFVTAVNCCITYYVCGFVQGQGMIALLMKALLCIVIPNMVYLIAYFWMPEFKESQTRVRNVLLKK